jgi:hypothetical protein
MQKFMHLMMTNLRHSRAAELLLCLLLLAALLLTSGCTHQRAQALYRAPPEECLRLARRQGAWSASATAAGVVAGGTGGVGSLVDSRAARVWLAVTALAAAAWAAGSGTMAASTGSMRDSVCPPGEAPYAPELAR